MKAELFIQSNDQLGEGPVWDHRIDELLWVDIEGGKLHVLNWMTKERKTYDFSSRIGCVVPFEKSSDYLVALQKGLARFNRHNNSLVYLANPEADLPNNRFNDGKCDPEGRFWVGSMDVNATAKKGALYSLDHDFSVHNRLSDLSISNGLAWDTDKEIMYFIDTASRNVTSFKFNSKTATISGPKTIIEVPKEHGYPDGMAIDGAGMLWIAHWGGANISRWNPATGQLLTKVEVPALHVTSLCFGGEQLDTIIITSAKEGLSKAELKKYPLSGSLFKYKPKIQGLPATFFKTH
jgi:sugar lactone lactonase YvrE